MELNYSIDLKALADSINEALNLNDNEDMFAQLTSVAKAKSELKDLLEQVETIESTAKGLINSKAKQLYGEDWQAIAGKGYKITRSKAGSVYTRLDNAPVAKKFLKIVETLNTKEIDFALELTGKLPKGLDFNPNRTEVIRLTLK